MQRYSNQFKTFSVRNSVISIESTKLDSTQKLLSTLRGRNQSSDIQVNPELASKVVREYILPMFKNDIKEKSFSKRRASFGISQPKHRCSSSFDGSFYSELKMSDQLSAEMKKLQDEQILLKKSLKDLEQKEFVTLEKLRVAEDSVNSLEAIVKVLNLENMRLESKTSKNLIENEKLKQQAKEYEKILKILYQEREKSQKQLHEEKANNDIR